MLIHWDTSASEGDVQAEATVVLAGAEEGGLALVLEARVAMSMATASAHLWIEAIRR